MKIILVHHPPGLGFRDHQEQHDLQEQKQQQQYIRYYGPYFDQLLKLGCWINNINFNIKQQQQQ